MNCPSLTILNHTFYPDLPGGVEWRLWHTARALAQRGIHVQVLAERRRGLVAFEQILPQLTVRRFAPPRGGRLMRIHDVRQIQRIYWWARILRQIDVPGLLWTNGYPMATLGAVLAGRRRAVVFNPSTCVAATNRIACAYDDHGQSRLSPLFAQLDRMAYRAAPRVVVGSQNLREQLADHYGRHPDVHVVPFGVQSVQARPSLHERRTARQQFGLAAEAFVIGFVGRLDRCKDLPFLLEAAARAGAGEGRPSRVLIVGDGSQRESAEKLSVQLGIAERVHWAGRMDDPSAAYQAMDVLAVPSVYETFGNVVLEAMAAGVPVIGRRRVAHGARPVLTANDELIQDGVDGLLVSAHDPADMARSFRWLATHPQRAQSMAEQAAARAAGRTWDCYARDLIAMLNLMLTRNHRNDHAEATRRQAA
jgi:glycosyltransferase involved in cell wall biosynthesis